MFLRYRYLGFMYHLPPHCCQSIYDPRRARSHGQKAVQAAHNNMFRQHKEITSRGIGTMHFQSYHDIDLGPENDLSVPIKVQGVPALLVSIIKLRHRSAPLCLF